GISLNRLMGIAPGISDIYILKCLDHDGFSVGMSVDSALSWIADSPSQVDIANLSLGGKGLNLTGTDYMSRQADYAALAGVCVVVAAGNNYQEFNYQDGCVSLPGVAKNVITVGSVNDGSSPNGAFASGADRISYFSNRGPTGDYRVKPDIVAPGSVISAPMAGSVNDYQDQAGTSMAAAHVSGVIAQLFQKFPQMRGKPDMVRAYLMSTAQDLGQGSQDQGAGRIDAFAALADDSGQFINGWFQGVVGDGSGLVPSLAEHFIEVPMDAARLRVFLVWHEQPAGAGASLAVLNNLDLLVEQIPEGDVRVQSSNKYDNVESVVIEPPLPGTYRIQVAATELALGQTVQTYSVAYSIVRGDRYDDVDIELAVPQSRIGIGDTFIVSATLSTTTASTAAIEASISIPQECLIESAALYLSDGTKMAWEYDTPFVYQNELTNLTPGELNVSAGPRRIDWHVRAFASVAYQITVSVRDVRHPEIVASDVILIGDAQPDQVLSSTPVTPNGDNVTDSLQPWCGGDAIPLFLLSGLYISWWTTVRRKRV
ncbi:MAG: S8 family serine peptidase, partial [Planctomycetota bacterium]